jgi:hypothetical protein
MNIQSIQGSHLSDKERLVIIHNNSNVNIYILIVSSINNNMYLIKNNKSNVNNKIWRIVTKL